MKIKGKVFIDTKNCTKLYKRNEIKQRGMRGDMWVFKKGVGIFKKKTWKPI